MTGNSQYITDRRYNGHGKQTRFGGNGRRRQSRRDSLPKKCFVCRKEDCWSTRHTKEERAKAYDRFKSSQYVQDSSLAAFQQFLAGFEGSEPWGSSSECSSDDEDIHQYYQAQERNNSANEAFQATSAFFGSASIDSNILTALLHDQAAQHAVTKDNFREKAKEPSSIFTLEGRYASGVFQGILPDSGAAHNSTAGYPQFLALQKHLNITLDTSTAGTVTIAFGDNPTVKSLGTTTVTTPFGPIVFHVMPTNTPFLWCLADMDRMGVKFDNLTNEMVQSSLKIPVIRKWGHPWMLFSQPEKTLAFNHLTDVELKRLHRRFGHPSVQRLHKLLRQSGNDVELAAIEHLTKYCHACQMNSRAPGRFKFTLRDDSHFNYEVVVDVMYVEGNRPVLHVIDTATSFQAARFLRDISARHTWDTLRLCWIDVYQGLPDWIVTDTGRNFHAAEFKQSARSMGIEIKEVPVEAHNSIRKVERYHTPLRHAYDIIHAEAPSMSPEVALQAAAKAVNDTAGPDGLVPTLLVFGAYPRMTDDSPPSPEITQRAEAIRKATKAIREIHSRRQVAEALATRNGPETTPTLALPLQSLVRIWRENKGWQGPFRLIATDGMTCTIDLPQGPRTFRSTVVKPYY